uniref:Uncharacterized protein n=1 Tax=Candidozyma auris TaxID=498019 RepID=A0A0L0P4X7_CANAR
MDMGESILTLRLNLMKVASLLRPLGKGNLVKIPELGCGTHGNVTECGDAGVGPGRSFLFLLTACDPGIGLSGDGVCWLEERGLCFAASGAPTTVLENPQEGMFSRQVVLITAAGLQG